MRKQYVKNEGVVVAQWIIIIIIIIFNLETHNTIKNSLYACEKSIY